MNHRRYFFCISVVLLFLSMNPIAHAMSVTLVKTKADDHLDLMTLQDQEKITLTFGSERVVIHNAHVPVAGKSLSNLDVPLSQLYIVRDRRSMAERTGYLALYAHNGFQVAVVKSPELLTGSIHVSVWPITDSMIVTEKPEVIQSESDPNIVAVLSLLRGNRYEHYLSAMAERFETRYTCSVQELSARNMIALRFLKFGLSTIFIPFNNICSVACDDLGGYNVIGIKQGSVKPDEYYLVGAHYDSISGNPCFRAPGANDNASGVAGVLELARVFSQVNTEASIIFAAFSGEEEGMVGSGEFVRSLVESVLDAKLKGFIILDMISYFKNKYGVLLEGSDDTPEQGMILGYLARLATTYTKLQAEISTLYEGSDHEPFLDEGMTGALLIESDWFKYPYYHTQKDLPKYQKISFGMEIVKLAASMLAEKSVASLPAF